MTMRRFVALAVLAASVAGSLPQPARAGLVNIVQVRNNYFDPGEVRIEAGETVAWFVRDGGHTLTADDGRFDVPGDHFTLRTGETFIWTFENEETFTYKCLVHWPNMRGMVVVERAR